MYLVVISSRARKSLRKYEHIGVFPRGKFRQALLHLRENGFLPVSYRDHQLHGELSTYREFHIASDVLVQYEHDEKLMVITITDVGTHTEFFGS